MREKPIRRMTLQELLTHTGKNIRDLAEQARSSELRCIDDLRDLSRSVRRRSRYPTFLAIQNALEKFVKSQQQSLSLGRELFQEMQRIRALARKDLQARSFPLVSHRESA
jgi:hypothetical protein